MCYPAQTMILFREAKHLKHWEDICVQSLTFWWIREAPMKEVFDNGRISWLGSLTPNLTINNLSSLNIVHLEVKADNIRLREHFSFIAFTIVPKLPNKAILGQLRGDISFYLVSMVTLVTNISHKQPMMKSWPVGKPCQIIWVAIAQSFAGHSCSPENGYECFTACLKAQKGF